MMVPDEIPPRIMEAAASLAQAMQLGMVRVMKAKHKCGDDVYVLGITDTVSKHADAKVIFYPVAFMLNAMEDLINPEGTEIVDNPAGPDGRIHVPVPGHPKHN